MAAVGGFPLVLVTGASGYIATHVVKLLQEQGYRVRGTVRSLQDDKKVKHLQALSPDAKYKLELVEADLTKPESWADAVKDVVYVIHVASPFPSTSPKDENEIIQPAVEGTQNVFKACVDAKTVKRIVLTSSCAAAGWGNIQADNKVNTEEDWGDISQLDAYAKSKTLAEKAAWDFMQQLPETEKIELAVVNPSYVMGPVLHGSMCTSMEVVKRLLERAMPAIPKLNFPVVDVRDVAAAHVKCMTSDEAVGKRHIIFSTNMWLKEMALILNEEFHSQGYNVPTMSCPYFALWINSWFDKTIQMILPQVGKVVKFDNSRMKDVLGIRPLESKESLIDMAYSMIEGGFIKKTKLYRGARGAGKETNKKEDQANYTVEKSAEIKEKETTEEKTLDETKTLSKDNPETFSTNIEEVKKD